MRYSEILKEYDTNNVPRIPPQQPSFEPQKLDFLEI